MLSWPGWLTYSGWLNHISGYPSATGRAQDSEVRQRKDGHSTVIPRNQLLQSITVITHAVLMAITRVNLCCSLTFFLLCSGSMHLFMAALRSRRGHYYFGPVVSSIFLFLLFSSPNLSRRRLDVCHRPTCTHDVALVQI